MKRIAPTRRELLICGAGAALGGGRPVHAAAKPGERVIWPEVKLLDGSRWGAAQAADSAVIVVFWSLTCPFCLRHNTHLTRLQRSIGTRRLRILTALRERDPDTVQAHLRRHGHEFAVTTDHAPLAAALSPRRITPLTVTVDRQGRLSEVIPGEMFEDDVMDLIKLAA